MTNEDLVVFEKVLDEVRSAARAQARKPVPVPLLTLSDIPQPPEKKRYDWNNAVNRNCDYCGHWESTALEADGTACCPDCATEGRLSDWQTYAETLREMLVKLAGGQS